MNRTNNTIDAGVRRAIVDLMAGGCDLIALPEAVVRGLIHEHLDYFLMMVGPSCPAEEADVVAAIARERLARTHGRGLPRTGAARGPGEGDDSAAGGPPERPHANRKLAAIVI